MKKVTITFDANINEKYGALKSLLNRIVYSNTGRRAVVLGRVHLEIDGELQEWWEEEQANAERRRADYERAENEWREQHARRNEGTKGQETVHANTPIDPR